LVANQSNVTRAIEFIVKSRSQTMTIEDVSMVILDIRIDIQLFLIRSMILIQITLHSMTIVRAVIGAKFLSFCTHQHDI
jgi:hypothetical protein